MSHIHVCLISEQTIPNILGIDYFNPDSVLFISTQEMQRRKKSLALIETLERFGKLIPYEEIIVHEDSVPDCQSKLSQWISGKEDSYFTVNITCGTKIMSIAVFEFFRTRKSKIFYIPVGKNEFSQIFPLSIETIKISRRLTVIEYLLAYSLKVLNEKYLSVYKSQALYRKETTRFILGNYQKLKRLLTELFKLLHSKREEDNFFINISYDTNNRLEKELFERLSFNISSSQASKLLTKSEIRYLTGGWLEEYVFLCLNNLRGSIIDDTEFSLVLRNPQGTVNEFDVMFTKDNSLYFIEVKSLNPEQEIIKSSLYKIGALQKEFGIRCYSFFVSTSSVIGSDSQKREILESRAEQFKTEVVPYEKLIDFENYISEKLIAINKK